MMVDMIRLNWISWIWNRRRSCRWDSRLDRLSVVGFVGRKSISDATFTLLRLSQPSPCSQLLHGSHPRARTFYKYAFACRRETMRVHSLSRFPPCQKFRISFRLSFCKSFSKPTPVRTIIVTHVDLQFPSR